MTDEFNPWGYGLCPHGRSGRAYCAVCTAEDELPETLEAARQERTEFKQKLARVEAKNEELGRKLMYWEDQAKAWRGRYEALLASRRLSAAQRDRGRLGGLVSGIVRRLRRDQEPR